nr:prokineticin-2 [Vulpes vulpes]
MTAIPTATVSTATLTVTKATSPTEASSMTKVIIAIKTTSMATTKVPRTTLTSGWMKPLAISCLDRAFLTSQLGPFTACDKDPQCGGGMCCAVSIWVKSIRICTPMGKVGDSCHPLTRKVPFFGRRMHHTCPCMPGLACLRTSFNRFICLARK